MQVLRFIVDGDNITLDPTCDSTGLFPGAEDRVRAEFSFSKEWESRVKVAAFWSIMDKEYPPQAINSDGTCEIPSEALAKVAFKVQVLGGKKNRPIVRTNEVTIYQRGRRR
jgi:hypothetical protein